MIYVSNEEMEEQRLASELLQWVTTKLDQLGGTEGFRAALTTGKGGLKELVEEIYPLALWGETLPNSHEVLLHPKIGSQNFDALVTDVRGVIEPFYVEITQAHKGYQEYLRKVHLESKKWAPGPSGTIKSTGTRARGLTVEAGRLLTTLDAVVQETEGLIEDAVSRKIQKTYPQFTRLLIVFEDRLIAREKGIEDKLRGAINRAVAGHQISFSHIYLVGSTQRLNVVWSNDVGLES